jgi:hypothetical protein
MAYKDEKGVNLIIIVSLDGFIFCSENGISLTPSSILGSRELFKGLKTDEICGSLTEKEQLNALPVIVIDSSRRCSVGVDRRS